MDPRHGRDPAGGRRLKESELLVMGEGLPEPPTWKHPKTKRATWHKGSFQRLSPQPIYELSQQSHILLGAPRYVVRREKLTKAQLPRGTYLVFVKGKATGLGAGMGAFTADRLAVVPPGKVSTTGAYRAVLER